MGKGQSKSVKTTVREQRKMKLILLVKCHEFSQNKSFILWLILEGHIGFITYKEKGKCKSKWWHQYEGYSQGKDGK